MTDDTVPRQVLLLKAPKEDVAKDPYVQILEDNGYTGQCIPVLRFEYVHLEELNLCLSGKDAFSCMALTSQRAVDCLIKGTSAFGNMSVLDGWKSKPVYVVGKATGQAVRNLGIGPIGEKTGNAAELVKLILADIPKGSKPVLFPCGNLAKEIIPTHLAEAGLELKTIIVYQTSESKDLKENLASFKHNKSPEYIVFFSPSGIEFAKGHLKDLNISSENTKFVAIGPSTREALLHHGYTVYSMSAKPTPQSLLEALNRQDPVME